MVPFWRYNAAIMETASAVTLSIKNVPADVAEALRARARSNHRSIQGELLSIVEAAVRGPRPFRAFDLRREIAALGLTTPADSAAFVRETRDER